MDKRARAQHAKRLIEDSVLQEAVNGVLSYHQGVFMSQTASEDEVLSARKEVKSLRSVMSRLESFVTDGKILDKKDRDREND